MDYFSSYDYVPHWLLILLLFLSSGALQYALLGSVKLVQSIARKREVRRAEASTPAVSLEVIHFEQQARISDEDLRERTEGRR